MRMFSIQPSHQKTCELTEGCYMFYKSQLEATESCVRVASNLPSEPLLGQTNPCCHGDVRGLSDRDPFCIQRGSCW